LGFFFVTVDKKNMKGQENNLQHGKN